MQWPPRESHAAIAVQRTQNGTNEFTNELPLGGHEVTLDHEVTLKPHIHHPVF